MAGNITSLLNGVHAGDLSSSTPLYDVVYSTLRQLARRNLSRESHESLHPTALVHEAYLRLTDGAPVQGWENRRHFYGAAAQAMRRILIDRARRRLRVRHGGGMIRVALDDDCAEKVPSETILCLDRALSQLERADPRRAEVVKLRYFAGLSIDETAEVLGISTATVKTDWRYARAWLQVEIKARI